MGAMLWIPRATAHGEVGRTCFGTCLLQVHEAPINMDRPTELWQCNHTTISSAIPPGPLSKDLAAPSLPHPCLPWHPSYNLVHLCGDIAEIHWIDWKPELIATSAVQGPDRAPDLVCSHSGSRPTGAVPWECWVAHPYQQLSRRDQGSLNVSLCYYICYYVYIHK